MKRDKPIYHSLSVPSEELGYARALVLAFRS